jgi:hypothetical protein
LLNFNTRYFPITLGLFSLFLGGLVYLTCRSTHLVMFTWFSDLGINSLIEFLRNWSAVFNLASLPDWFIYSLPNGLWVFSGILILAGVWNCKFSKELLIWLGCFLFVAFGWELGQGLEMFVGVFCWTDLRIMVLFSISAFILIFLIHKKNHNAQ